ncbi:MAG TPA: hypothetical protein VJT31_22800 [Rugosimonospora sp.]|nr:hypothetical protein [Rugosimonospora sp.]
MGATYRVLSDEDAEHFLTHGYVVVRGCFSREAAREYTRTVWTRLGYDPADRSSWTEPSVHMPSHRVIDVASFAPRAWGAVCDLVGGAERISASQPYTWNDGFIVNLGEGADRPWAPASPTSPGWHKDGDFFRHFLDSPEQGLLTLVLWSDVRHQGGATFVAADSIGPVAGFLAAHSGGVYPPQVPRPVRSDGPAPAVFDYATLVAGCREFVEATGEVGDVYLLHPYLLHARAQNLLHAVRVITNPPLTLAEPMHFDRRDPADHSLVERAVLHALDVDRYRFTPTAGREALVPPRVLRQRAMLSQEVARLEVLHEQHRP